MSGPEAFVLPAFEVSGAVPGKRIAMAAAWGKHGWKGRLRVRLIIHAGLSAVHSRVVLEADHAHALHS